MGIAANHILQRSIALLNQWPREARRKRQQHLPPRARPVPDSIIQKERLVASHKWYFYQCICRCYACAYGNRKGDRLRMCTGLPNVVKELLHADRGISYKCPSTPMMLLWLSA